MTAKERSTGILGDLTGCRVIMFFYRDEIYDKKNPEVQGKAEIIVVKQRNAPTGHVDLSFIVVYTRFENQSDRE